MTTLKVEDAFAVAGQTEALSKICSGCFACYETVCKCAGCYVVSYCSKQCQKSDWVDHKNECRLLKASGTDPGATVRLVAKILLKPESSLVQTSFNDRSWDSLDYHIPSARDEQTKEFYATVNCIADFMKPLKNISREVIIKTLAKVERHRTLILDQVNLSKYHNGVGLGIYLGLTVHKHSCIPDSQLLFAGRRAILRGFDPTRTSYSTDLTISYTGLPPWDLSRKDIFKERYSVDCTCPLCIDENHIFNRMGSSCYVSCCWDGAGILDENSKGPYKCNKCGEASTITVDQVKCAESKAESYMAKTLDPRYILNLKDVRRILHENEKILSTYNFHYIHFLEQITYVARSELGKNKEIQLIGLQHSDKKLRSYRYYLHPRDSVLAHFLLDRSGMKLLLDYLDGFDIETALDEAESILGTVHPAIVHFKHLWEFRKKINAEKREELFREAGQYKW